MLVRGGKKLLATMDGLPLATRTEFSQSSLYRHFLLTKMVKEAKQLLRSKLDDTADGGPALANKAGKVRREIESLLQVQQFRTMFERMPENEWLMRCSAHHGP